MRSRNSFTKPKIIPLGEPGSAGYEKFQIVHLSFFLIKKKQKIKTEK